MKVFWSEVTVNASEAGFAIALDGRPLRTPSKAALTVPTDALAQGLALEWREQTGAVRPETMPLTRAANTVIDRVIPHQAAVTAEIARYGETDLLCYRAPDPAGLVARQKAAWDPLLDWAGEALGAPLHVTTGLMHCLQPAESLEALRLAVEAHGPWQLAGLHDLVTLSGSLIIGLAVSHQQTSAAKAWPLSRIDEDWNIEEWGEDAEAAELASRKHRAFLDKERLLNLLRS
ncbi:MAG: ATP12 family protein [Pseudomonadota bacterium]